MDEYEKIMNISSQVDSLYSLISVVLESCLENEFYTQAKTLKYAQKLSLLIMAKLSDLHMDWPADYFNLDID